MKNLSHGTRLWIELTGFIFVRDLQALVSGKETFTDAWRNALTHPTRRWIVIVAWFFTTKHLFFGKYIPWLDPFGIIGLTALGVKRMTGGKISGPGISSRSTDLGGHSRYRPAYFGGLGN